MKTKKHDRLIEGIKVTTTAESFSKEGKLLAPGKKKVRLVLGEDERFAVYAKVRSSTGVSKVIEKMKGAGRFVEFETKEGTVVELNIRSLSKRLHLSTNKIRQLLKQGELKEAIDLKQKEMEKILDSYDEIFKVNRRDFEALKQSTGFDTKTLMKAIKTAYREISKAAEGESVSFKKNGIKFIATQTSDGLNLMQVTKDLIGKGSFGKVTVAKAFARPDLPLVSKKILDRSDDTREEILNEASMVRFCNEEHPHLDLLYNQEGRLDGIPPAFHAVFNVTAPEKTGYIAERCFGDLTKMFRRNGKTKVNIAIQLLKGLENLSRLELVHYDIKPENILVKKNGNQVRAYFADFGGAIRYEGGYKVNNGKATYTPAYQSTDFSRDQREIFYTAGYKNSPDLQEQRMEILKKNDRLALGLTLYELFLGRTIDTRQEGPFKMSQERNGLDLASYNPDVIRRNLSLMRVSEPIQELLVEMLQMDQPFNLLDGVARLEQLLAQKAY